MSAPKLAVVKISQEPFYATKLEVYLVRFQHGKEIKIVSLNQRMLDCLALAQRVRTRFTGKEIIVSLDSAGNPFYVGPILKK